MGCHALLQGIFPTQGLNPHLLQLLHCRWVLTAEPRGKPRNTGVGSLTLLQQIFPTQPFRYDLNQIPYDYIVEVMTRVKGLDLVDKSA